MIIQVPIWIAILIAIIIILPSMVISVSFFFFQLRKWRETEIINRLAKNGKIKIEAFMVKGEKQNEEEK